jgi:hypothetical protein
MEKRPLVVLFGDSVLIDGVAVSLGEKEGLEVTHLDTTGVGVHERLGDLEPDLVVFELDSPYASSAFTFLREHPGIILVGLDLTCSRTIVLDSQQHVTPTLDALCQIVQTKVSEKTC